MAKQIGTIKLVGTIDDVTYYEMDGEHWARKKSSLTAKRFREDPCFEGSRRAAGRFGAGSALASAVYGQLPKKARKHGLQGRLTAMASRALRAGSTEDEVTALLRETLGLAPVAPTAGTTAAQGHQGAPRTGELQEVPVVEQLADVLPEVLEQPAPALSAWQVSGEGGLCNARAKLQPREGFTQGRGGSVSRKGAKRRRRKGRVSHRAKEKRRERIS